MMVGMLSLTPRPLLVLGLEGTGVKEPPEGFLPINLALSLPLLRRCESPFAVRFVNSV